MIFIGHFSFESSDRGQDSERSHGYFTCVVEGDSVEKAMDKFQRLLYRLRKASSVFDELESIYLDSCIEIRAVPKNGFLAYFKEIRGEYLGEISTELVGVSVSNKHISAYHVVENSLKEDPDSSVSEPFLIFKK